MRKHTLTRRAHIITDRELDYIWPARDKAGWRAAPNLTEVTSCNGARLGLESCAVGFLEYEAGQAVARNHLI